MKVLILSCNTGQGHNTAARALAREFTARGIYCEVADALAFDSKLASRFICGIYAKAAVHTPRIYSLAYNTAELIAEYSSAPLMVYLRVSLVRRLTRINPIFDSSETTEVIPV